MTYQIMHEMIGSRMFPAKAYIIKEDFSSLTEKIYLTILAVIVLMNISEQWATAYVKRAITHRDFDEWFNRNNDLYVLLWALTNGEYKSKKGNPKFVAPQPFIRWLTAISTKPATNETKKLCLKLDDLLHSNETSMRAIRRIVQDWSVTSVSDHKLAVTRLLQMLRSRMPKSDVLNELSKAAQGLKLELVDVNNPEKTEVKETATAGATASASVASVASPLGFDPNGHKGIYDKKPLVIRRVSK